MRRWARAWVVWSVFSQILCGGTPLSVLPALSLSQCPRPRSTMRYPLALALLSLAVAALERLRPWRPAQRARRARLWGDLLYITFNGHLLGVILYGVARTHVLPRLDPLLERAELLDPLQRGAAAGWPLWAQAVVALLVIDLLQWCVHRALHRAPWLWELHKVHHSVRDGEMDWLASFRFQWTEVVVYRAALYLPLSFFSFSEEVVFLHAVAGTLAGHLNHANLDLAWGPLRYVLNGPRMHLWHHDYHREGADAVNFGVIFSCWDWLFGTAYLPAAPPARIGFRGEEELPRDFLGQQAWPLPRLLPPGPRRAALGAALGAMLIAGGWLLKGP